MKEVGRCADCNKHTMLWSGMGNDIVCRECFEKKVIV
jgi:ribosomal protein S27E